MHNTPQSMATKRSVARPVQAGASARGGSFEHLDLTRLDWSAVFADFGVPAKLLDGNQGPCPICRKGKTKFRYDNKFGSGNWFCNDCKAGDGIRLISAVTGKDAAEVLREIREKLNAFKIKPGQQTYSAAQAEAKERFVLKAVQDLVGGASPLDGYDPASLYLKSRLPGLTKRMIGNALRYHPAVQLPDELRTLAKERGLPEKWPALLGLITKPSSEEVIGVHRIYLDARGHKAPFDNVKFSLGSAKGWVRLGGGDGLKEIGVIEGIESGLAVAILTQGRVTLGSCLTATGMEIFEIPEVTETLRTYGDNDRNGRGFVAQDKLVQRARSEGKLAIPHYPAKVGWDFNDVLLQNPESFATAHL